MRIERKTFAGRREVFHFNEWAALCQWLKDHWLLASLINDARKIKEGYFKELRQ